MTLGDIAVEQGDLRTAERHYAQSLDIAKKMGAINEEMGAYRRLSSIALKEKRYDEAREFARKAFDLVQRIGSKYENAQIEEILGDLEIEQGRQTEALEHYEKAAGQYTSLSKYRYALKALSKIGLIHAASGNTFEARHYLDRAQDYVRADIGRELPEEYSTAAETAQGPGAESAARLPRHAEDHDSVLRSERAHGLRERRAGVLHARQRTPSRKSSRRMRARSPSRRGATASSPSTRRASASRWGQGLESALQEDSIARRASRQPVSRRRRRGRLKSGFRRRTRSSRSPSRRWAKTSAACSSSWTATACRCRNRTTISSSGSAGRSRRTSCSCFI